VAPLPGQMIPAPCQQSADIDRWLFPFVPPHAPIPLFHLPPDHPLRRIVGPIYLLTLSPFPAPIPGQPIPQIPAVQQQQPNPIRHTRLFPLLEGAETVRASPPGGRKGIKEILFLWWHFAATTKTIFLSHSGRGGEQDSLQGDFFSTLSRGGEAPQMPLQHRLPLLPLFRLPLPHHLLQPVQIRHRLIGSRPDGPQRPIAVLRRRNRHSSTNLLPVP